MIRTVLIFVYITLVLLVSGLARAAGLAQVQRVEFDQSKYMLHVAGAFMNACQSAPKLTVLQIVPKADATVVRLGVIVASNPDHVCQQVMTGKYDLVFDLRTLELPTQKDLSLVFENATADSRAPIAARIDRPASGLQFSAVEITGQLRELPTVGAQPEPVIAVVGEDGTFTQVKALVDLSDYMNNNVRVSGIPMGASEAPEMESSDFGSEVTSPKLEKVFATEISLTPL